MRVNKAKRRLLRWYRYEKATHSQVSSAKKWNAGYHFGHVKAWSDVTYAGRWAPNGIREPWRATLWRPGT